MRLIRSSLCGFALLAFCVIPSPVYATAALASVVAAGSYAVATAAVVGGTGVATVGVAKDNDTATKGGLLVAVGGLLVAVADPPAGIFYNGSFAITYPSNLLTISSPGWLGPWGVDPNLPTLPVDPNEWGSEFVFTLQAPNSALSATINNTVPGTEQVSFNWGANGFAVADSNPFNFFANLFTAKTDVAINYLGSANTPPPGANFYVSSWNVPCSPPGQSTIGNCGETTTQYFEVSGIPEPSIWSIVLLGLLAVVVAARRLT